MAANRTCIQWFQIVCKSRQSVTFEVWFSCFGLSSEVFEIGFLYYVQSFLSAHIVKSTPK
jgi:Na+/melibiose symporter-like transporter